MKLLEFIYWKSVDVYRGCKGQKKLHLYGVWLFCGLYGRGKTMGLTEYLLRMRRKYGDKIYICTNYGFKYEDFPLMHWEQLIPDYDKPIIFGYDEIQNEFNSRDYKNFPSTLVMTLTQNRKGNGKQIVGTAQRFTHVDKFIRDMVTHVCECNTSFGRWTKIRRYDVEDYNMLINTIPIEKKVKIPCHRYSFIQGDDIRSAYDSFQMLQSARSKEYQTQEEILAKYGMIN